MILWFSRPWMGVRDKQQCSSMWYLMLHCSCRLPGTAIPAAFPPRGHTHHQPWNWQEADRSLTQSYSALVEVQLRALGCTCPDCTFFLQKAAWGTTHHFKCFGYRFPQHLPFVQWILVTAQSWPTVHDCVVKRSRDGQGSPFMAFTKIQPSALLKWLWK